MAERVVDIGEGLVPWYCVGFWLLIAAKAAGEQLCEYDERDEGAADDSRPFQEKRQKGCSIWR